MNDVYTKHALARRQQRSLPPAIVDWLFDFGARTPQNGAEVWFFDRRSKERLGRALGSQLVSRLGHLLDAYAVVSDGQIVTLGYRYRRILRR